MSTTHLIVCNPWNNNDNKQKNESIEYEDICNRLQTVAIEELREDKNTRGTYLAQFGEWILQNKDIESCITDEIFLLRFLRTKKYSLYMAQQMLLKYLNLRKCFKYIFYNMDYLDPNVYEIITSGYIFASPFKDKQGRRVIITTGRKFDTTKFKSRDMARAHLITYETLIDEEQNQILGFTHIADCANTSPSAVTMWNISEFITLVRWGEQSFPMRHKEIHIINVPTAFQYVYDFASSLGSQKLRSRVKVYGSFGQLHASIDPHILPEEYGGTMPMNEMVNLWKKELAGKRERLLSYDQMNLISADGIVRKRSKITPNEAGSIEGSFRKLEVD